MKIITWATAKRKGLKRYFIGVPCPKGHVSDRRVSTRQCIKCATFYRTKHYKKNAERYNERRRVRNATDPEFKRKKKEVWHRWAKNNAETFMLSVTKTRAKKFNIKFNLTVEDIVIPKRCPILGIKLKRGLKNSCDNSPTVDRVVPNKGYVKGNVAVISDLANRMKGFATSAQHRRIADWIDEHGAKK